MISSLLHVLISVCMFSTLFGLVIPTGRRWRASALLISHTSASGSLGMPEPSNSTYTHALRSLLGVGNVYSEPNLPSKVERLKQLMQMRQANASISGDHALSKHTAEMWYKELFQEEAEIALREPFDDKKVMLKLRRVLNPEDMDGIFRNPIVGDWL